MYKIYKIHRNFLPPQKTNMLQKISWSKEKEKVLQIGKLRNWRNATTPDSENPNLPLGVVGLGMVVGFVVISVVVFLVVIILVVVFLIVVFLVVVVVDGVVATVRNVVLILGMVQSLVTGSISRTIVSKLPPQW